MSSLESKIAAFISDESGIDQSEIDNDTPLFSDGFIDSFTAPALIIFIENETGIKIPSSDVSLENFDSISLIKEYISRKG